MVEFSIVAALLLMLVFGMIDYGRYFLLRTNLTNAVREGARYGAVLTGSAADTSLVRQYTRARITAASSSAGALRVSFPGTKGVDRRVRVAITNYPFSPATFLVIKSAKTMAVAAEFRLETQ